MATEVQKCAQEQPVPRVAEDVVVVSHVQQAESMTPTPAPPPPSFPAVEKEAPPVPETEQEPLKPKQAEPVGELESAPFKEESTKVSDLLVSEKRALEELRQLVQGALSKHELCAAAESPTKLQVDDREAAEAMEQKTGAEAPEEEVKVEPQVVEAEETKDEAAKKEKIEMVETKEKVAASSDATVDDDGAKTVEAIEETVVAVSSSALQEQTLTQAAKEPETKEAVTATVEEGETKEVASFPAEEVSIWGIPLLADERSDVILLKFLRARDFKVKDAFTMLKNTIKWRKEFGIDELLEQDLGDDLGKAVFMQGSDKEGHPVCYNVYGEFQDKELYQKWFSDKEKRNRFLKWRIQFLERSIRKLDFRPGGISTIVQINDLKNSPGPTKKELRQATKQALQLLQDNYPEFVAKQVFINVPWWYLAFNKMISPFLTQRTRSKFVFAGPSKSAEILFRYISAEQIPVKYGGLSKDGEFSTADTVTEITVKPAAKHTVEFPVSEICHLTWEVRVVGWEVNYGAEFVPSAEESYTVIIQKARKITATEEPVVSNSFKIAEPGKIVLTIDNPTSKKKKLIYRLKTKVSSD